MGLLVLALAAPILVSPAGNAAAPAAVDVASAPTPTPRPQVTEFAPADPTPQPPAQQRTASGGSSVRPAVAETVEIVPPDLVVRPPQTIDRDGIFAVLGVDGVQHLAGTADIEVTIAAASGPQTVRVLVVDPVAFRPLTPEATARTRQVWERLSDGEAVVRHDVAHRLGLELGGRTTMTGPSGTPVEVRIGAFASNGTPPLADAIVPWELGSRFGVEGPNMLVVALRDDAARDAVGAQLSAALGGGAVTALEAPTAQQAELVGAGSHRFRSFSYIDHGDGMITIDPAWVREFIVDAEVPVFGTVRCHRAMIPQLRHALQEVVDAGLAPLIDTSDYGGCWVPRHILFDPDRSLSMHAWGLAIDFNVHTNMYGDQPTLDGRIVDIFRRWGFGWGGAWSTPDGMHFELATLVQ